MAAEVLPEPQMEVIAYGVMYGMDSVFDENAVRATGPKDKINHKHFVSPDDTEEQNEDADTPDTVAARVRKKRKRNLEQTDPNGWKRNI